MGKVTKLNLEEARMGDRRRLHLRDIQDDNPEPRGSIGAELRAARLRRGEDIAAVASRLRIRRDQLEAIEGSDYARLPGRAYSIGFIKSYADYLGLDQKEAVAAFKAELDEAAPAPAAELVFPDAEEETRLPRGTVIVIAVLVLAALYGVWTLTVSADRMVDERAAADIDSPVPQARVTPPQPSVTPPPPAALAPALPPGGTETPAVAAQADAGTLAGADAAADAPADAPAAADVAAGEDAASAAVAPVTADAPAGADAPATADAAAGNDAAAAQAAGADAPAETAQTEAAPAPAAEEPAEDQISPLETGAERAWEGFVYGQQNHDSRVFIRAHETAWVRVEDGAGNVLLSRTLRGGESYRAPDRAGLVLATRNAGAVEVFVDGASTGRAGRAGEVIADLPLDPAALSGQ